MTTLKTNFSLNKKFVGKLDQEHVVAAKGRIEQQKLITSLMTRKENDAQESGKAKHKDVDTYYRKPCTKDGESIDDDLTHGIGSKAQATFGASNV